VYAQSDQLMAGIWPFLGRLAGSKRGEITMDSTRITVGMSDASEKATRGIPGQKGQKPHVSWAIPLFGMEVALLIRTAFNRVEYRLGTATIPNEEV
jgi:hypothetical protein